MVNFSLFQELKRRNVLRAGVLYAGAVWAFGQGLSQFSPAFGLPDWVTRWFLVAAIIGFPFWLAFAWFYEFTPSGLKRESEIDPGDSIAHHTGRKLNYWITGVLAVAVVLLLTNQFVLHRGANEVAAVPPVHAIVAPFNSIAVLPFANESDDKQQDYFSDGISEDLLTLLTKVPQLQVTARTSSFYFKGKDLKVPEIARQLHVAHVLEGSVRKAGNQVRITAQLVDAASDTQLWSQSYDRTLDDVFKIQDEIAADVVKHLKLKLLGAVPTVRATDPQAYAFYLQARQLAQQGTAAAFQRSDALYRQALAIDPRYAPAWNGLSANFGNETNIGLLSNQQGYAQARAAAAQALAIDPDYAPAHAWLGYIATADNNLAGAAQQLERALALDPANPGVLGNSAALLASLGRLDEALTLQQAAVRRDPVNVGVLVNLGIYQRNAGRFDAAITSFHTALSLSPGRGQAHYNLGVALLLKGDAQGTLAQMQQETSEVWKMIGLPLAYHALGRKADADAALAALIAKYAKDAPYNIAYVQAYRGEADQAFAWLDKAIADQDPGLSGIVTENLFDRLHADTRWLPFLRRLGYAPEQLAKITFKVTLPEAASLAGEAASPPVETSTTTATTAPAKAGTASTDQP